MGWFKVDDHYFTNPKVWEAGEDAALLNLQGIAYCSANQTDGRIPHGIAPRLTEKPNVLELIECLIDAGLWKKTTKNYIIHDYLEHQSSRAQIRAKREKAAKRQSDFRTRNGVTSRARNGNVRAPDTDVDTDTDVDGDREAERPTTGFKDSSITASSTAVVAREGLDPQIRDQALEALAAKLADDGEQSHKNQSSKAA